MMKCLWLRWAGGLLAAVWVNFGLLLAVPDCRAQTTPSLPPGVQDVVKLVKAGLNEEVVLAEIKHVGGSYSLSADQIIYLHQQGVSQTEISALLGSGGGSISPAVSPPASAGPAPGQAGPAPSPATTTPQSTSSTPPANVAPAPISSAPPAEVPAEPTGSDSFRAQLAPYGTWMDVPGYGLCWRPSLEASDPWWRPYCDEGHWVYTAEGWSWQSDYPWGAIPFHYGRWYRDSLGWVWVPGYDWAPAWVCWRQADGYCGWAPLPPAAVFRPGVGLWFDGRIAVDVDFGLGLDAFTFVAYGHFWDYNLHGYLLPRERLRWVFGRSVVMNGYRLDHGRFIVEGLGREHMAALTHHEIRVEHIGAHDAEFRGHAGPEHGTSRDDRRDWHGR